MKKITLLLSVIAFFAFTQIQAQCYTPVYSTGTNLIADPEFNAADLATGGFTGWGDSGKGISTTTTYCGGTSAYIHGSCWPNGGSMDRALPTMAINTKYRLRAMVNSEAAAGKSFQIQVEGVNGATSNYYYITGNTGGWKLIDTTFVTGATLGGTKGIYFNSCTSATPDVTAACYIDNYELFPTPMYISSTSVSFLGISSKKVAVRAQTITNNITITAPTGFSVSPTSMLSTVNGDSLTITFNGPNSTSGYVYFTSGSQKDSVLVTGTIDPTLATSVNYVSLDELNTGATFTVTGGNLTEGITMTAPQGITLSPTSLPTTANGATVTVTYDAVANSTGYITLTSGTATKKVRVLARKNTDCFTPFYPNATNLVADPYLNSLTTFGGWGSKGLTTDTAVVYCGKTSGVISGGSLDRVLTGLLKVKTRYFVKAMIKATSTNANLGVYGWSSGQPDYVVHPTVTGSWAPVEMTFTTGATMNSTQGLFFNNASGSYIDNWEMYAVPKVYPSSASLSFLGIGAKKVAVRAESLSSDITITAPAGYSVTPTTMLKTVSGSTNDSLTITFNGPNSASGYVYFVSGSVKDSIQVTGTVAPSVTSSVSTLVMDDLNKSEVIVVNGGNLTNDITITAPAGISVSPTTILKTNASNVNVTVTYDGTTSNVSGNIALTSGSVTTNVSVVATKNSDCFTPLYSTLTNIIPSPQMNTLTGFGGWGFKSVVSGEAYCGKNCIKFDAQSNSWPNGAALDVTNISWAPNATYRFRAMVKAVDGSFAFLANNTNPNFLKVIPQSNNWVQIDTIFVTGANPGTSFFTFNNVDGGATGKVAYIDNYELYNITTLTTSVNTIETEHFRVYQQNNSLKAAFELDKTSTVELSVFNIQGMQLSKEIKELHAGSYLQTLNVQLNKGVYIVRMTVNGKSISKKIVK